MPAATLLALLTLLPGPAPVPAPPPPVVATAGPPTGGAPPAMSRSAPVAPADPGTAGRGAAGHVTGRRSAWVAPVDGPVVVVRPFAPPPWPWLPGHRGVDLAAVRGTIVRAAGGGTVTVAGDIAGRGVVVVAHPDGLRTTYEPVSPLVSVGDVVAAGDALGTVADGAVHCGGPDPCLHWGLRRGHAYLDPMLLLEPLRAVLLPP